MRGGANVAIVTAPDEVCLHSGERIFSMDTALRSDHIREKPASQELYDFQPIRGFPKW